MLGLPDCQISLGEMFEFGRGVKKDFTPAVKHYKAAAEQGHVDAQNKLKSVYEKVNKEYLDAQKAVAQQQMQQMQQHQELQQRFQWQILQAQHQQMQQQMQIKQMQQQMQQQISASGLSAVPEPPTSSLASVIAGNLILWLVKKSSHLFEIGACSLILKHYLDGQSIDHFVAPIPLCSISLIIIALFSFVLIICSSCCFCCQWSLPSTSPALGCGQPGATTAVASPAAELSASKFSFFSN
jgi:hypothetical protein